MTVLVIMYEVSLNHTEIVFINTSQSFHITNFYNWWLSLLSWKKIRQLEICFPKQIWCVWLVILIRNVDGVSLVATVLRERVSKLRINDRQASVSHCPRPASHSPQCNGKWTLRFPSTILTLHTIVTIFNLLEIDKQKKLSSQENSLHLIETPVIIQSFYYCQTLEEVFLLKHNSL